MTQAPIGETQLAIVNGAANALSPIYQIGGGHIEQLPSRLSYEVATGAASARSIEVYGAIDPSVGQLDGTDDPATLTAFHKIDSVTVDGLKTLTGICVRFIQFKVASVTGGTAVVNFCVGGI